MAEQNAGQIRRGAVVSADERYRYRLMRSWGRTGPFATFVMLNPSVADAHRDDPTVRRCMAYARRWGCAGLLVVNVYAVRATSPVEAMHAEDPVGPENDEHLAWAAWAAHQGDGPLVAAWGAVAKPERVEVVHGILRGGMAGAELSCLGVNRDGSPKHPLYVAGNTPLTRWPA